MQQNDVLLKHSRFAWQYLVWPGTVIQVSRTRNSFYPIDLQKHTECILLSWLLSFLYTWNLKYIFWEENLWQFLIALSFLSKSFFMHRRGRVTYDQISAVNGLMRCMILKLHGNETPSSCDQRLPESDFGSHFRSTISKIKRERNHIIQGILIKK